jgi:hypothetical protein
MRRPLLPLLAALALVPVFIGCDSSNIPTNPPAAATEPYDILAHLRYLAVRKDYQHAALIAPITPDVVFPSARQFHKDAQQMGLNLTPEEIKGLGIENIAARLDELPGGPDPMNYPDYTIKEARLAFNAGIYRLLKGLTAKSWGRIDSMGITDNNAMRQYGSTTVVKDMALGIGGKKIMTVSCLKKPDGTWGVSLIRYEVSPKSLKQD